ncbi:MAG: SUMF1/EgtB/PvdO family nonheme iron enzyme, partial [Isosphaeraceae bacterium]
MRLLRRVLSLIGFVLLANAVEAAPLVQLSRWDRLAVDYPLRGPGIEQFRLVAVTRWAREAPEGSQRYAVRVTLPNGQVVTHPVEPGQGPGGRTLAVLVPVASVRNLRPDEVRLHAEVIDAATNAVVSNLLKATIANFPTPKPGQSAIDPGPFGWGRPLSVSPGGAGPLPGPGPDGFRFVLVVPKPPEAAFAIATTEASIKQVASRLDDYDSQAGRSDEFVLEADAQPAINLTPNQAQTYLSSLSKADDSGLVYRLPTLEEWDFAARAGQSTPFWWGGQPTHSEGANFLGPEPALATDTTAPALPARSDPTFQGNPWGLFHTFGNVAEWAKADASGFVRLGGHFRTEPETPLPGVSADDPDSVGPDPYVGVRPVASLTAEQGEALALATLKDAPGLGDVKVAFDPGRATLTLTGNVAEASARREADRRLSTLWFLSAVDNRLDTPSLPPRGLAVLGPVIGSPRRITPLGKRLDEVSLAVRWANRLPVKGSEWWVNLYQPGGYAAHRLASEKPDASGQILVVIDRSRLPMNIPTTAALSLGGPAPTLAD